MYSNKPLFPLLAVIFLGYLGFSLALPIFPPLFLNPIHNFLPKTLMPSNRRILLGLLFSMYPIGQFIGAPIMGKFSDKHGRRPILLLSLLALIPAYILCGFSVRFHLPYLTYISRFLCGLFEGNITTAQAALSDISHNEHVKTKNFGHIVTFSSSAFFFGPLIGGALVDSDLTPFFHFETPFWCAAFLVFIALLIVYIFFHETHHGNPNIHIHPFNILKSFIEVIRCHPLSIIFTANLCYFTSIFFFLNFFSAFLLYAFNFSAFKLGQANAYLAIFVMLGPLFFTKLSKKTTPLNITSLGGIFIGLSLLFFLLPSFPLALIFTLIPIGFLMAVGFAYPALLISNGADKTIQGQALGANMAIQVFAEGSTAVIGGFLMAITPSLPIWIGAMMAPIGGLILFIRKKKLHAYFSLSEIKKQVKKES